MITVYCKSGTAIRPRVLSPGEAVPSDALWIDMQSPSLEEETAVEQQLGIEIPSKKEVWKNQVLNRLYQEHGVTYMTAAVITKTDSPYPQTSSITFILSPGYLFTLRYITPTSFQTFAQRVVQQAASYSSPSQVLEGLLEEVIDRVAHNSEVVVQTLDELSHNIFGDGLLGNGKNPSQAMKGVLNRLGACNDLNSKINESLHSFQRMLTFFRQTNKSDTALDESVGILLTDVSALVRQTAFLSDKITFQLDATLGMINVEQNLIIKIFSVVAVFFLPPTLVSSMYGMNFHNMPELNWTFGYPMAVAIMMLCALVPFLYFRKKGWL